jgi:type I restriction enzyme S subunit
MSSEWTLEALENLTDGTSITYGVVKPGDECVGGVPFIRGGDIVSGRILMAQLRTISTAISTQYSRTLLRGGELLISLVGNPGEVAIAPHTLRDANIARQVGLIRIDESKANANYVQYFLRSKVGRDLLIAHSKGSVQQVINLKDLKSVKVPLPPLQTQGEIAFFMQSLDDRITLLRETNATLEAIAQALFKSWFVDFDPVRAKMEGRAPEGMIDATAALFPDSFEESELGLVPRGWKTGVLADLTTKIGSGATPRGGKEVYLDDGVALIRSQNVYDSEFVWSGLARISDDAADQLKSVEVQPTDVLLNITGASILRTCVAIPDVLPARVNQHVAIIRAKESIPSRYIHLHLLQGKTKEFLLGLNAGGSREAVTKAHIESVPIIRPSDAVLAAFKEITNAIYLRSEVCSRQERTLATLRDTLLPRLISGQLRLPEARAAAEEALA